MMDYTLQFKVTRLSATTWRVTIEEPATGKSQTLDGVVADSAEHAVDRVVAAIMKRAPHGTVVTVEEREEETEASDA